MSFPPFKFKELIEEDWETSTLNTYLSETRFLFVIYKYDEQNNLRLKGCQFWNIPYNDLEIDVRNVWEQTKDVLRVGFHFEERLIRGKKIYMNPLPKMAQNKVAHVRPHSKERAYKFSDGSEIGDIKKYANELPDGQFMTTQSFWLNKGYIRQQLKKKFFR